MRFLALLSAFILVWASGVRGADGPKFERGLSDSPDFFPIAVWLQAPANAGRYKEVGINVYVGLWNGPTEAQLAALEKAGMPVICEQNEFALKNLDRRIIVGWMHGDEPDNAQSLGTGKGYGPPIAPAKVVEDYQKTKEKDPTRPVLLNLGQGVAWDGWYGRGVRTNKPEDYPEYAKGCDIASYDIYPVTHDRAAVAGKLWFVAHGVDRLRKWTDYRKPVWCCIECTHVGNAKVKPTPHQVKAEVWMALIHGAKGLLYFAHEFQPKFIEAGMLADAEMAGAVGAINRQIRELAGVLNSPTVGEGASVASSAQEAPIDILVKRAGRATYVLAVAMRDAATKGSFAIAGMKGAGKVTVLGENRTIDMADGKWQDEFKGYEVHLYKAEP